MTAQTSNKVSRIAARYIHMDADSLLALTATAKTREGIAADIRTLAASCLRQDETKGLRGLIKRVAGL